MSKNLKEQETAKRKWWLAGTFSYLVPGLGQVYNGQATRGLLFYSLFSLWGLVVFAISLFAIKRNFSSLTVILFYIAFFIALVLFVLIIADAVIYAWRHREPLPVKSYNRWTIYALALVLSLSAAILLHRAIQDAVIKTYRIAGPSMQPAIMKGDYLLNNKLYYSQQNPQRGDIVTLTIPQNKEIVYVKRIIAIPGDTLAVNGKKVYINNKPLDEPYVIHLDPNIISHTSSFRDYYGPIVIPNNQYFTMGDNRDFSYDSRYWGPIQRSWIRGKAGLIYFSVKPAFPYINLSRIGKTAG